MGTVASATSATDDVIALLSDLVAIDSVNPSLVPGAAGERRVADHVAAWGQHAGLSVELIEEPAGRPSVVVRTGRRGDGRVLLLCGHLDTVGHGEMTEPLVPRVESDRMYGRGAYDMKAGLAAALIACRDAGRADIGGEVIVAAVADEEHSSSGVQQVLRHVTADAAIVTEPTELAIATAHKGFVWIELEVLGRAAHGSRPHLGIDAILKTGPILVALGDLDADLRVRRQHPTLGPASLHASLISGGTEESTIPGRCLFTVERRTLPGETVDGVEQEISEVLGRCRAADPEVNASQRTTLAREPFEVDAAQPIVGTLARAAGGAADRAPDVTGVSYWADSAFLHAAGIPTVLYGPGGEGAHAAVEWVSLDDTRACARTLTRAALEFCR
jgi:acetylornithine deacetylase